MKIIEKSGYQALPWVRYITQSGGKSLALWDNELYKEMKGMGTDDFDDIWDSSKTACFAPNPSLTMHASLRFSLHIFKMGWRAGFMVTIRSEQDGDT